jgi:acyl-coenzyme A thioesterase PaaI-like protein
MSEEEAAATFLHPMGIAVGAGEGRWGGRALVSDALRLPGSARIRSSVLACWADMVSGTDASHANPGRTALTVDLTVRLLVPPVAEMVVISSEILKAGRRTVVCEARMCDERGRPFALSHMTFQSSPRPEDVMDPYVISGFAAGMADARPPSYPQPFMEFTGIRMTGPGACELDRRPRVMNPAGTLQGGAVAAMVEAAAESLAGPVGDMELHYVSAVRVGPGRARAVATGADGPMRVEVRDPGNGDRLCTLGLAWPVRSQPEPVA